MKTELQVLPSIRAFISISHQLFIEIALNLARVAQCIYQHIDGHVIENHETKDRLFSLLIQSIPLNKD